MTARTGQCLCGAVKFRATPKNNHVDACHCSMCRRHAGGPVFAIDCGSNLTLEDDAQLGVYESSEWAERCFCKKCGSSLFWRLKDGSMHTVFAGAFDDLDGLDFTTEIFIDEKPGFYSFSQPTKKMTGAEVFAMFNMS
ncbi:MAG: GFA family protein [Hyphococcus sp.]